MQYKNFIFAQQLESRFVHLISSRFQKNNYGSNKYSNDFFGLACRKFDDHFNQYWKFLTEGALVKKVSSQDYLSISTLADKSNRRFISIWRQIFKFKTHWQFLISEKFCRNKLFLEFKEVSIDILCSRFGGLRWKVLYPKFYGFMTFLFIFWSFRHKHYNIQAIIEALLSFLNCFEFFNF